MRSTLRLGLPLLVFAVTSAASMPASLGGTQAVLIVRTVPGLENVTFSYGGVPFATDANGQARISVVGEPKLAHLSPPPLIRTGDRRFRFARWTRIHLGGPTPNVTAVFDVDYRVSWKFVDLRGRSLPPSTFTSFTLKSRHGVVHTFEAHQLGKDRWLQGRRVVPLSSGFAVKDIDWTVQSLIANGSNVVNRSQQGFFPRKTREVRIRALFYPARFRPRDALFRFPVGSAVRVEFPDGHVERREVGPDGSVSFDALPRGEYRVSVEGPGISLSAPVALSKPQDAEILFLSYYDMAVAALLLLVFALGLPMAVRRRARRRAVAGDVPEEDVDVEVVVQYGGSLEQEQEQEPEAPPAPVANRSLSLHDRFVAWMEDCPGARRPRHRGAPVSAPLPADAAGRPAAVAAPATGAEDGCERCGAPVAPSARLCAMCWSRSGLAWSPEGRTWWVPGRAE